MEDHVAQLIWRESKSWLNNMLMPMREFNTQIGLQISAMLVFNVFIFTVIYKLDRLPHSFLLSQL